MLTGIRYSVTSSTFCTPCFVKVSGSIKKTFPLISLCILGNQLTVSAVCPTEGLCCLSDWRFVLKETLAWLTLISLHFRREADWCYMNYGSLISHFRSRAYDQCSRTSKSFCRAQWFKNTFFYPYSRWHQQLLDLPAVFRHVNFGSILVSYTAFHFSSSSHTSQHPPITHQLYLRDTELGSSSVP